MISEGDGMRLFFKTVLLIAGVILFFWGLAPLGLLAVGDKADAIITEGGKSNLNTEMKGGRRSINKPTGFFSVKTKVRYRFDVHPTPLEALKRLSDAPIATNVSGLDTLYGKTRFPDIAMHPEGDSIRVIFLKPWPAFNAAYQPNTMLTFGVFRLIGGIALIVWGLLISSAGKRKGEERGN